ncbi:hypothetical protein JCM1841_004893 [Sporobolomyces salmonicolor]
MSAEGDLPVAMDTHEGSTGPGGGAGGGGGGGGAGPGPKGRKAAGGAAGVTKAGKDKGEKKTRSKAACSSCKSVKQKCEGPPYVPCRRCELYKLDCQFPPGTKTIPRPPEASPSATAGASTGEPSPAVAQKLFEIATRLQSIESALHINHHGPSSPPNHLHTSTTPSHHAGSVSAASSDAGDHDIDEGTSAVAASTNPINEINATIESICGHPGRNVVPGAEDYGAPDVLRRGVLAPQECQDLFDFFFASVHPWLMNFSLDTDRDALSVRQSSPLLFHTILLLATAYAPSFPSQLHLTLVTFTNNILAPQILSPQPHELTTDFTRAINLLNLYKPVQLGPRRAEGKDDAEAMRTSKVNGLASWMLQGILARTAEMLELSSTTSKFARAYSASAAGTPIPAPLIRDLRLYYCLLWQDIQGNVQSGRRCNMEGAQALTTTRLFSSLHLQPYDVRLAASVEMTEIARPILRSFSYERTRRIPKPDLERFNAGMRSFDETWLPVLIRQLAVDPLALTVVCPFREFISLQFNATCYVSWKTSRMYASSDGGASDGGGGGRPGSSSSDKMRKVREGGPRGLTDWEWEGLGRCVKAAEMMVFTLSEESRIPGAWRNVQWEEAERSDGWRKLVLDDQMVEQSKWGMDAITCISYVFPLVFLSRLVNEGLLTTNLKLLRHPTPQPAWLYTQKLPRLLELGAAFLDAIAPNNVHHPARAQAQVVRNLLDTGVKGRIPTPVPAGPTNAATVMSPPTSMTPQLATQPQPPPQQQHQQQPYVTYAPQPAPPDSSALGWASTSGPGSSAGLPAHSTSSPYPPPPPPSASAASQGFVPGMDEALHSVLNDFAPLFGESAASHFWEFGGGGGRGGGQAAPGAGGGPQVEMGTVDWSEYLRYAQAAAAANPQPPPPLP